MKNLFGRGYHIKLTKKPECEVSKVFISYQLLYSNRFLVTKIFKVTEIFQQHIREAMYESEHGSEISYLLPFESSPKFPALFTSLDAQAENLAISGYGATITTLEEVFLRFQTCKQIEL